MSRSGPLVSIGFPVRNGERYLRRALDSLLAQDYHHLEIIISDNASTDATAEICLDYASKDSRIRYCRNPTNLGAVKNFNRVFELASGEYFMWAAHHDLWHRAFVSACLDVLINDPLVVLCYTDTVGIDWTGKVVATPPYSVDTRGLPPAERFRRVIRDMPWYTAIYGLIRAQALRRTRLNRNTYSPDIVLLAELSLIGEFQMIPRLLFWYHRDEQQMRRTLRQRLLDLDPANERRLVITRFAICTMIYHLLSAVGKSDLPPSSKVALGRDVIRICAISRWRDPLVDELRMGWLLRGMRFGKRLIQRLVRREPRPDR